MGMGPKKLPNFKGIRNKIFILNIFYQFSTPFVKFLHIAFAMGMAWGWHSGHLVKPDLLIPVDKILGTFLRDPIKSLGYKFGDYDTLKNKSSQCSSSSGSVTL
jgi:hypothetical protein